MRKAKVALTSKIRQGNRLRWDEVIKLFSKLTAAVGKAIALFLSWPWGQSRLHERLRALGINPFRLAVVLRYENLARGILKWALTGKCAANTAGEARPLILKALSNVSSKAEIIAKHVAVVFDGSPIP